MLVQFNKCIVVCGSNFQRGHSGNGCLTASILFKYERSRGHLFVLSWAMVVGYASPSGPMCLRCLMLTLSGPVELLFFLCFISAWICVVVIVRLVVCSFSVVLSMCLFVLCVLCLNVLVNF